jgi:trimethylamine--corrinoid protein Co-methyltransferase
MKFGTFATGSPEYGVLEIAGSEMARHYGLPSMMSGYGSSAKTPGVQAGFEKGITTAAVALSDCDLLTGIGSLNDASYASMEELLIDAQMWEDIKRTWAGMEVNESDLALEVIEKVGPKGQYLSHPHTFANYRKFHVPKYRDRSSYTAWEASGKKDMLTTVQAEVKDILARHRPKPLDKDVELKLAEIEKRASKAVA